MKHNNQKSQFSKLSLFFKTRHKSRNPKWNPLFHHFFLITTYQHFTPTEKPLWLAHNFHIRANKYPQHDNPKNT